MDRPRTSISTSALAAVIVVMVIAAGIADYAYFAHTPACCVSPSKTSSPVSHSTTTYSGGSTYTYSCPSTATCDFLLSATVYIACTGCQFSGDYSSPSTGSTLAPVSGFGNRSYPAYSFDSPLYVAWNISKDTAGGTLEVKIVGEQGQTYYDEATSSPFGTLAGIWAVAVATATESQSSAS